MLEALPDILTVHEVAELLRVDRRSIYKMIEDGEVESRKLAGKYRITKRSIIDIFGFSSPLHIEPAEELDMFDGGLRDE